jgi:hypothetical protein
MTPEPEPRLVTEESTDSSFRSGYLGTSPLRSALGRASLW